MNDITYNELTRIHAGSGPMATTAAAEVVAGAGGLTLAANLAGKPIPGSIAGAAVLAAFSVGVIAGGAIDWGLATVFNW